MIILNFWPFNRARKIAERQVALSEMQVEKRKRDYFDSRRCELLKPAPLRRSLSNYHFDHSGPSISAPEQQMLCFAPSWTGDSGAITKDCDSTSSSLSSSDSRSCASSD